MYKLTITKSLDRKGLVKALRNMFVDLSLSECFKIIDNLPFVNEEMWSESNTITNILEAHCIFSYEDISPPYDYSACKPPWEQPEYISAKNWYDTLPEEDRTKIDILVRGNVAWG
jgi:hypothetical protein